MRQTDWLEFWAGITPDKTAIIEGDNQWSYQTLNDYTYKTVNLLVKHQISKGDRIVIIAEFTIEYLFLFGAAMKSGIILVPLNYRLTPSEINKLVEDVQPSLILYQEEYAPKPKGDISFEINSFFQNINERSSTTRESRHLSMDDDVFILYTSGSSGKPKGVKYTYKMMYWNAVNTQVSLGINSDSKTIICMPPFHTGGWNVLLTPLLHCGGTSILKKSFDAAEIFDDIKKYHITIFMGVPTMLRMMTEDVRFNQAHWPSLRYIIVGGEAMPKSLIKTYHDKGVLVRQGFGMTEAGPNLTSLHDKYAIEKIGSIGRPNMYVDISIVDENDREVADGEQGELRISGPIVLKGYYSKPEMTKKSFKDGWFYTGDIVIRDEDGFLYIVDRIKNMYISGGENVYPAEVERTILNHEKVSEAIVIGVSDSKWGEVGKALIIPKKGSTIELSELQEYCKKTLSKFKIPKHLELISEFPKNDTGKIDRKSVRNKYG